MAAKGIPFQHPCKGVLIGGLGNTTQGTTGDHHRPNRHQKKIVSTIDRGEVVGMKLRHWTLGEGRVWVITLTNGHGMQMLAACIEGGAIHWH